MNVATQKRENRASEENREGVQRRGNGREDRGFVAPEANIVETKDAFVVTVEMPGVSKDGLELTLENNVLTIVGHRKDEVPRGELLHRESRHMDYRRVFELTPTIDTGKIQARVEQGVLRVELPKAEKVKPRKITVNG